MHEKTHQSGTVRGAWWRPADDPGEINSLTTDIGVGDFRVNPRFHPTLLGWNLGLTWEFPTPTDSVLSVEYRDVGDNLSIPQRGKSV